MTLTREQTEALAKLYDANNHVYWDRPTTFTAYPYVDGVYFDPTGEPDQFDVILRAHYIRASKANLDNLRDVMMCGHGNLTDWRAAVLVKIAEVG